MKLQKQLSRTFGGVDYPKFIVVIPPKAVKEAGWKEGTELEFEIKGKKIILEPKNI